MENWGEQEEEESFFLLIFSFLSIFYLTFYSTIVIWSFIPKSNVILERGKKQVKMNKKFTDQKYKVKNKEISKTKVKVKMVLNFEMQLNNVVF